MLEEGVVLLEKPFTVDTLARALRDVLDPSGHVTQLQAKLAVVHQTRQPG